MTFEERPLDNPFMTRCRLGATFRLKDHLVWCPKFRRPVRGCGRSSRRSLKKTADRSRIGDQAGSWSPVCEADPTLPL